MNLISKNITKQVLISIFIFRYFTPTSAGSSPPQVAPIKPDIFPFLGFPQGFPGFALPGLTGFNPFLPPNQDKSPTAPPTTVPQKRPREDPLDLTEKRVKVEKEGERGENMSCGSVSPGSISPGSTTRAKAASPRPHPALPLPPWRAKRLPWTIWGPQTGEEGNRTETHLNANPPLPTTRRPLLLLRPMCPPSPLATRV